MKYSCGLRRRRPRRRRNTESLVPPTSPRCGPWLLYAGEYQIDDSVRRGTLPRRRRQSLGDAGKGSCRGKNGRALGRPTNARRYPSGEWRSRRAGVGRRRASTGHEDVSTACVRAWAIPGYGLTNRRKSRRSRDAVHVTERTRGRTPASFRRKPIALSLFRRSPKQRTQLNAARSTTLIKRPRAVAVRTSRAAAGSRRQFKPWVVHSFHRTERPAPACYGVRRSARNEVGLDGRLLADLQMVGSFAI